MLKNFFNFVKIEHTLFSLPVVFAGCMLAVGSGAGQFSAAKVFWILLAVLGARTAGFGFNRILDCKIDAQNPRTQHRELPSGKISVRAAWSFTLAAAALFFLASAFLSATCLKLAPIPIALFFLYPFLKRITMWTHFGLGFAWGAAPLGGWLAIAGEIHSWQSLQPVLLLFFFCLFWVAGFDILYALLDEDFDRAHQVYSMPARMGKTNALRAAQLAHFAAFLFLGFLTQQFLRPPAFLILAFIGFLLVLAHWKVVRHGVNAQTIDFAFFKVNVVLGILVLILMRFGG